MDDMEMTDELTRDDHGVWVVDSYTGERHVLDLDAGTYRPPFARWALDLAAHPLPQRLGLPTVGAVFGDGGVVTRITRVPNMASVLSRFEGENPSVDVDFGWYELLFDMDLAIAALPEDRYFTPPRYFRITQKFGLLRVSVRHASAAVRQILSATEDQARHICERCGYGGELRERDGWRQTLCDWCMDFIEEDW
jgi:hypothetical protein